jgi:hypothetical protein
MHTRKTVWVDIIISSPYSRRCWIKEPWSVQKLPLLCLIQTLHWVGTVRRQQSTAVELLQCAQGLIEASIMDYSLTIKNSTSSIAYVSVLVAYECFSIRYSKLQASLQSNRVDTAHCKRLQEDNMIRAIKEKMIRTSSLGESKTRRSGQLSATSVASSQVWDHIAHFWADFCALWIYCLKHWSYEWLSSEWRKLASMWPSYSFGT